MINHAPITDYTTALDRYISAVQKETKIKVEVQNARHALQKSKQGLREMEEDLLQP